MVKCKIDIELSLLKNLNNNSCLLTIVILLLSFSFVINNNTSSAFVPKSPGIITSINKNFLVAINPGASDAKSQNPYNISQVTVPVDSNVTWINNDKSANLAHTITSGTPDKGPSNIFYSPDINVGENFTFAFNKPGIYPYYDRNYQHMKGQVIVKGVNENNNKHQMTSLTPGG